MARLRKTNPTTRSRLAAKGVRRLSSRGSSLIELLIAAALFGVALLAVVPLFVRAIGDVRTGSTRSTASVLAQNALEAWSPPVAPASSTPARRREFYSFERRRWLASPPSPPDRTLWVRLTTVRRYPLSAVDDGRISISESGGDDNGSPGIALLGVTVSVSRDVGSRPLAQMELYEWTDD